MEQLTEKIKKNEENDIVLRSYSQVRQDIFVLKMTDYKYNGTFLEIGSNHPITINNTYILEKMFNWKGVMVEKDSQFLELYKKKRPNCDHVIGDAVSLDYTTLLEQYPRDMDYLQIDLHVDNNSTLNTLIQLNDSILKTHRFATITFEHDYSKGDYFYTKDISRKILFDAGYVLFLKDVLYFEDWYIHPGLINPIFLKFILPIKATCDCSTVKIIDYINPPNASTTKYKWYI
jgi:hypothetical protein